MDLPLARSRALLSLLALLALPSLLSAACATSSEGRTGAKAGEPPPEVIASSKGSAAHPHSGEPPRSPAGSDLSTLPSRYPQGVWLPIEAPLLSMQLVTKVRVNGTPATATLDTGAMSTVMSVPMAAKLGVLSAYTPRGRAVKAFDAHGDVIEGERLPLGELHIGAHRWVDAEVLVIGDQPGLFLIGADLLQSVDLYLAADEGLVGLFEPGAAPVEPSDRAVSLIVGERQLQVKATARSAQGDPVQFPLIVDTGASGTSVPALVGVNGGLPADLAYESRTLAVGGESRNRGRFVLDPLHLGDEVVSAGRVLALGSTMARGEGAGLLGNDVMMRHHTVISFARGKMWLRPLPPRPALRTTGPGGVRCTSALPSDKGDADASVESARSVPCIHVGLREPDANVVMPDDAMQDLCLQVDVARAYAGKTLELAITAQDERGEELFNGGALRAFVTVNGEGQHGCFTLWRQLDRLGLEQGSRVQLRWVRTEGILWPCDPMRTQCLTFTGPLARLKVR